MPSPLKLALSLCTVYSQINTDGTALVNNEDLFLFIIFNANVANKRISIQHSKKGTKEGLISWIPFHFGLEQFLPIALC